MITWKSGHQILSNQNASIWLASYLVSRCPSVLATHVHSATHRFHRIYYISLCCQNLLLGVRDLLIFWSAIWVATVDVNVSAIFCWPPSDVKAVAVTFQLNLVRFLVQYPLLTRASIAGPHLNATECKTELRAVQPRLPTWYLSKVDPLLNVV